MFPDLPFESDHDPRRGDRTAGWLFVIREGKVLVRPGDSPEFPGLDVHRESTGEPWLYLGRLRGRSCWAVRLDSGASVPSGLEFHGLRSLFSNVPDDLLAVAGRAVQVAEWDETHRFCGRCGTAMFTRDNERAKECPACGHVCYPRVAPAMMVLVTRGRSLLLARAPRFTAPMFSALAGFVEAGESIEDCIRREVREEVGIEIRNPRYFASQPWPFPHSLMIAFTAEYAGGELVLDPNEIAEAHWYDPDDLPPLPGRISIARRLIDATVAALREGRLPG